MNRVRKLAIGAASRDSLIGLIRYLVIISFALIGFAVVLLLAGKDPIQAYDDVFTLTLSNSYGRSEILVRMIPLMLTAVAVALPSRLGLINIGSEGQLHMGAWLATWGALYYSLCVELLLPRKLLKNRRPA